MEKTWASRSSVERDLLTCVEFGSAIWRAGRRHGWPVRWTVNGSPFVGYVGERWGRFFLVIEPELREALGARVGDLLAVAVVPTHAASAVARAIEQSTCTTQPTRARTDAVVIAPR